MIELDRHRRAPCNTRGTGTTSTPDRRLDIPGGLAAGHDLDERVHMGITGIENRAQAGHQRVAARRLIGRYA